MLKSVMQVLSFTESSSEDVIKETLKTLNQGGIVAYPTESFYALGVLAENEEAVKKLYGLKKRPAQKPLPLIVGDIDILKTVVKSMPDKARDLAERFWPGPLTIIFEARDNIPRLLTGGSGKVAVRVPGQSAALRLAIASKLPITATSANPSSLPPAKKAEEVVNYFGERVDVILDGGETPGGKPSTIIDVTVIPPRILRHGSITLDPLY
jgi:L-threonylcarbamoyladenylate synthase